jgi:hypothetical protein
MFLNPGRWPGLVWRRAFGPVEPARLKGQKLGARSWESGEKHFEDDDDDENEDDSLARHIQPRKLKINNELQV